MAGDENATPEPAASSRREHGPEPDFALVRPYVATLGDTPEIDAGGPEQAGPDRSGADEPTLANLILPRQRGRRWKATIDAPDATAELIYPDFDNPDVDAADSDVPDRPVFGVPTPRPRRWLSALPLILAAAVVVAIALIGTYLITSPSGTPAAVSVPPAQSAAQGSAGTSARGAVTPSGPGASPSARVTRARASTRPASASPAPASPVPVTPATILPNNEVAPPAPVVAVTGTITGIAGLCIDDASRNTSNGNPINLFLCDGSPAQRWTVATDGTLRVLGKCMQVTSAADGGLAELWDCDGSGTEAWRAGASGELVNSASGLCLELPGHQFGARLDLGRCQGSTAQRWTLPSAP